MTDRDVVCSSDPYVAELARRLGAEPVVVDADRTNVPISATMIRDDPGAHLGDARTTGTGVGRGELDVKGYCGWGTMRMYGRGAFHPSG